MITFRIIYLFCLSTISIMLNVINRCFIPHRNGVWQCVFTRQSLIKTLFWGKIRMFNCRTKIKKQVFKRFDVSNGLVRPPWKQRTRKKHVVHPRCRAAEMWKVQLTFQRLTTIRALCVWKTEYNLYPLFVVIFKAFFFYTFCDICIYKLLIFNKKNRI